MTSPDINFVLAAADAFRRLAEIPDADLAGRSYWSTWLENARRLVEQRADQDCDTYAAVNDRGYVVGEKHHRAKLSDADINLIHELAAAGLSQSQIAAKFDYDGSSVARSTVGHILSGRRRSHTVMGHRLVAYGGEPICWPCHPDEFKMVRQ